MKKISELKALYTGDNGKVTYGYIMQSDRTEEECKALGLRFEFPINTYNLITHFPLGKLKEFGFSESDIYDIKTH
jgi:hypothetical protein